MFSRFRLLYLVLAAVVVAASLIGCDTLTFPWQKDRDQQKQEEVSPPSCPVAEPPSTQGCTPPPGATCPGPAGKWERLGLHFKGGAASRPWPSTPATHA